MTVLVGARRVYEVTSPQGMRQLRLSDRVVELGEREFGWYRKVAEWLPADGGIAELSRELDMPESRVPKFIDAMVEAGLFYRLDDVPKTMTGVEFHKRFNAVLNSWLSE